jgi:Ser/Thr protein kinase RdoA (MazF antagonist)
MLAPILSAYGLNINTCNITPFGTGLINHTWKIVNNNLEFILQRINHQVFKNPASIAENIEACGEYLQNKYPNYLFIQPAKTLDGQNLVYDEQEGFFRMFPFVQDSLTYDTVPATKLAYEAAKQFGKFTKNLAGFPIDKLHTTLPDFHNLTLRYEQFKLALINGNQQRVNNAADSIAFIQSHKWIVTEFDNIKNNPAFRLRVTHHDTKISNVLFDKNGSGLCVIDLDTVMPGYFISDVGDMLRTYLSPVSEEESDFSKIEIREDYFQAILDGYLSEMKEELSKAELAHFVYAGEFMIYMQATRFLTDYILDDIYYGAKYEGHNLVRANNQIALLKSLFDKKDKPHQKIGAYVKSPQEAVK